MKNDLANQGIDTVRKEFHRYTLQVRAIDRLLDEDIFKKAWDAADTEKKEKIIFALLAADTTALRKLISHKPISLRRLRAIASQNKIANYCRMSIVQLTRALSEKGITF